MQEKRDDTLSPEIQEMQKKMNHILEQCELIAQRQNRSKGNQYIQHIQGMVSEQISGLKANLEHATQDIKEKITEKKEEMVEDAILGKITDIVFAPIEGSAAVLNSEINTAQNGLKTLTKALDTQDKNFLERTVENTTNFFNGQKRNVMQMYDQFKETGSTQTNFQQLTTSIPEAKENAVAFIQSPSTEKFDKTLTSATNTAGFFMRYLDDKIEETAAILEKGEQTVEKSVEKHGGVFKYTQSIVEKADRAVEKEAKKIDSLDSLYSFYQNIKKNMSAFSCLPVKDDDEFEVNPPSNQSEVVEDESMEYGIEFIPI